MFKNIKKIKESMNIKLNPLVEYVISKLTALYLMNLTAIIFSSLDYDKMMSVMRNTYYIYSIFIFGGFIISLTILMTKEKKK